MQKEDFLLLKKIHDKNNMGYTLISDNELMFDSKGQGRTIIFDSTHEIIHAVSVNPDLHHYPDYPAQVISTELANIQYIESPFTIDELTQFLTEQTVDPELIEHIISKLK